MEWEDNETAECFRNINGATAIHKMEIEVVGGGVWVHIVHEVQKRIAGII